MQRHMVPARPMKPTVEDEMTEDEDVPSLSAMKGKPLEETSQVPPICKDRNPVLLKSPAMPLRVKMHSGENQNSIPKSKGPHEAKVRVDKLKLRPKFKYAMEIQHQVDSEKVFQKLLS